MVMPENIDMKFDDFCEGCVKCDLQIKETNFSTLFDVVSVRCENRDVCRMWNKKMRGEQNEDDRSV